MISQCPKNDRFPFVSCTNNVMQHIDKLSPPVQYVIKVNTSDTLSLNKSHFFSCNFGLKIGNLDKYHPGEEFWVQGADKLISEFQKEALIICTMDVFVRTRKVWWFHVVVLQMTAKKMYKVLTHALNYCSVHDILYFDFLVAITL